MDIKHFILYTTLGAGIRNLVLFIAGYVLGQHRDKVVEYNHIFKIIVYGIIAVALVYVVLRYILNRRKKMKA